MCRGVKPAEIRKGTLPTIGGPQGSTLAPTLFPPEKNRDRPAVLSRVLEHGGTGPRGGIFSRSSYCVPEPSPGLLDAEPAEDGVCLRRKEKLGKGSVGTRATMS